MASSALKSAIILLMLTRIYDCTTYYVDDFEIQGNNLRGGYGTDNETLLRVVMLHIPPFFDVVRNSSNHIIKLGGVIAPVLQWFSRTMNVKFEIIPDNILTVEDNAAGKGLMSYIVEGKAEIIFGPIAVTHSRFQKLNFPYPLVISTKFALLIPMPSSEVDVNAVWKPFQGQIWIFLVASITATSLCLYGISHFIAEFMKNSERRNNQAHLGKLFEDIGRAFQYSFGVILSQGLQAQGGTSRDQKLTIRVLAGTWCVACFVLVTAYSSVLTSFVTSPYYKPLIRSVHDIPKNPQIKITLNRGWVPDRVFSNADEGTFKYLGDQLRKEPDLRCNVTEECLERVRKGSSAYVQEVRTVKSIIGLNLKKTGKCDFTMAKELFLEHSSGLAIAKNMDVEHYNRGLLKAHQAGLLDLWFKRDMVDASHCLNPMRDVASNKQRVTLAGLSGAFVVLAFGLGLSVLCFCGEVIIKLISSSRNKRVVHSC